MLYWWDKLQITVSSLEKCWFVDKESQVTVALANNAKSVIAYLMVKLLIVSVKRQRDKNILEYLQ